MRQLLRNIPVASLVLAIGFSTPVFAQDDAQRQLIADLVVQVQQLQDEVRQLRGQLEDMGYRVDTLQQRQTDQYLDLDTRLNELRAAPAGEAAVDGAELGTLTPDEAAIDATRDEIAANLPAEQAPALDAPEVRDPVVSDAAITGVATPTVAVADTPAAPEDEKAAYDAAFQALKDLRYADAAEGFDEFLAAYPQSEYADNAQYWLGESYYVTGNYEIALDAFRQLLNRYPDSAKLPDGLLKIGYTHYELEQFAEAQAALEEVRARYPDTTVARLAEHRLRQIRLETS